MINKITFHKLINNLENYDDHYDLYIKSNCEFALNDQLILILDDENNEVEPDFFYIFGIYILKDIIANIKEQKPTCNEYEVLKAIKFYYENDAFIEL